MNKYPQNESKIIIGNSGDQPSYEEKTNIQLKDAHSLMHEVEETIEDEAPTSVRSTDDLEAATRQFHSQVLPVIPEVIANAAPIDPAYPQTAPMNFPPADLQNFAPTHFNQTPSVPATMPMEPIRVPRPEIKFTRMDEPTVVSRPAPTPNISPGDQQAALNEIFNKSSFNKKEFIIKAVFATLCTTILAVIIAAKVNQHQTNSQNTDENPEVLPSNSGLITNSKSEPSTEPVLSNTPPEAAPLPSAENSAESTASTSPEPAVSVTPPIAIPTYIRPSQIPTKLDPTDPYAEPPKPQPIQTSTQKPATKPGIIREVPF